MQSRRMDVLALREALAAAVTAHGVVHVWHTMAGPAFTHIAAARYAEARKAVARRVLGQCLREVFAAVPRPSVGSSARALLVAVTGRRDALALDAVAAAVGIAADS